MNSDAPTTTPSTAPMQTSSGKRERLIDAASRTVYAQGFARTTIADIAREAEVPLGNVYYYFKTKEALGEALVDQRVERLAALRTRWEREIDPRARLVSFVRMTLDSRDELARSGCPIGTFCSELRKDGGPLADRGASIFSELLTWLEAQFVAMDKGAESRALGIHLLAALQGTAVLAHSFGDTDLVVEETRRLEAWIHAL